jgi:hypothetical protein
LLNRVDVEKWKKNWKHDVGLYRYIDTNKVV